jgi:hypothetical protein
MIGFAGQRLMELEVGGLTGAEYGEKDPERLVQRNGYRDCDWETRAATVDQPGPSRRSSWLPDGVTPHNVNRGWASPRRVTPSTLTLALCAEAVRRTAMKHYAGLDVGQQTTLICIVDEDGRIVAENKAVTCPEAIAAVIKPFHVARAGLETGPLSVWLWNELKALDVPIIPSPACSTQSARPDTMRSRERDQGRPAYLWHFVRQARRWLRQTSRGDCHWRTGRIADDPPCD